MFASPCCPQLLLSINISLMQAVQIARNSAPDVGAIPSSFSKIKWSLNEIIIYINVLSSTCKRNHDREAGIKVNIDGDEKAYFPSPTLATLDVHCGLGSQCPQAVPTFAVQGERCPRWVFNSGGLGCFHPVSTEERLPSHHSLEPFFYISKSLIQLQYFSSRPLHLHPLSAIL